MFLSEGEIKCNLASSAMTYSNFPVLEEILFILRFKKKKLILII